jgi:hypothetical protein
MKRRPLPLPILFCAALAAAIPFSCGDANTTNTLPDDESTDAGRRDTGGDRASPDAVAQSDAGVQPGDFDGDTVADAKDNCPAFSNTDQSDADSDGIGDACDCVPADAQIAAYLVATDDLATEKGTFAPAAGFDATSWSFGDGAYRQGRLALGANDATFLQSSKALEDVFVEVRAASTEIADQSATDLRQIVLLAGASSTATTFTATGCGIEVVEGLTPSQKISVLALGGSPGAVTTTATTRVNRTAVQANEEFRLRMIRRGGQMTCTVTVGDGGSFTATASGVGGPGAIGFLTRETKALFKDVKVCRFGS